MLNIRGNYVLNVHKNLFWLEPCVASYVIHDYVAVSTDKESTHCTTLALI